MRPSSAEHRAPRIEVIDPGSPGVDLPLLRTIAALRDHGPALVLGPSSASRIVQDAGLEVAGRVPVDAGPPRRQADRVRRSLETLGEGFRLRTWSENGLVSTAAALRASDSLEPILVEVAARPPAIEPFLRQRHPVRPIGPDLGPRLAARGWRPAPSWSILEMPVPTPPGRGEPPSHASVIGPGRGLVVAMAGGGFDASDAFLLVKAAAIASVAGAAVDVVLSPRLADARACGRWLAGVAAGSSRPEVRVILDRRVEDPAMASRWCDVAVLALRPDRIADVSLVTTRAWLAAGVPVLGPPTRGMAALVEDGLHGRLLPPGQPTVLARALSRIAEDPAVLQDMRHATRARHAGRFGDADGQSESSPASNDAAAPR